MFKVRCMPKPAEHPNANAGAAANDWITHSFPIWLEELNKARREPLKLVDAGDPRVLLATLSLSALQRLPFFCSCLGSVVGRKLRKIGAHDHECKPTIGVAIAAPFGLSPHGSTLLPSGFNILSRDEYPASHKFLE